MMPQVLGLLGRVMMGVLAQPLVVQVEAEQVRMGETGVRMSAEMAAQVCKFGVIGMRVEVGEVQ